ncbi:hypothetical protein [Pontiella sulfatireligans]|uniref:Uncharacterized protein n=1 Tax=Pontiella sulfatireligans TaxID=2750658 RepID=A0A6C2UMG3_9BACT|nr:hypothetical protein [Pontiella sulfatireligans]VGO20617.1 hypothetical protein SCARR_02682 [Pontiella sulfatireligans]
MKKNQSISGGVLISRYDSGIQYPARKFLEEQWGAERIDLLTAEDPLHLLFHHVDDSAMEVLFNHIADFLEGTSLKRLALAGGCRPDTLTDGEVHFKLKTAAFHLHRHFPEAQIEVLFVNQFSGVVEEVFPGSEQIES